MPVTEDTHNYLTLAELQATLNVTGQDYLDDDLTRALNASSTAINRYCQRRFWKNDTDEDRVYTPASGNMIIIDDCVELTTLVTDQDNDGDFEQTWVVDQDFYLAPLNANLDSVPYTRIMLSSNWGTAIVFPFWNARSVKASGIFGWDEVPYPVIDACSLIASQFAMRLRDAPFGIITSTLDVGVAARIARSDPQIMQMLDPLRREYAT